VLGKAERVEYFSSNSCGILSIFHEEGGEQHTETLSQQPAEKKWEKSKEP